MIKKDIPIYFYSESTHFLNYINFKNEIGHHRVGVFKERTVILPRQVDSGTINPKNFITLKEKGGIGELLILDRIKGTDKIISIQDHVNRSGQNFLRSNTPEGEYPQFPDMSKIYNEIGSHEKAVVHTIGIERFKNQQALNNIIFSELVGLIAPVAYYVGIKIFALGAVAHENILDII